MRDDIESIQKYISLEATLATFGELPSKNFSKIIILCENCSKSKHSTVLLLKNGLKKNGKALCNSCSVKLSWTSERRKRAQELWNNPEYRNKCSVGDRIKNDIHIQDKHRESCKRAYDGQAGLDRRDKLSRRSKENWQRDDYRQNQTKIKHSLWKTESYRKSQSNFKTEEFRVSQSNKMKLVWNNPDYIIHMSNVMKQIWQNPEYRELQVKKQKSVWQNPEYRELQVQKQKSVWQNSEYRQKYEKLWDDPVYKERLSKAVTDVWNRNPQWRQKSSKISKSLWELDSYREKIISGVRRAWQNPEYRESHIKSSKAKWMDPEFRNNHGVQRSSQSGKKSSLELITESILDSLQIRYEQQTPVGPYVFDFYLPDHSIYIECQGEYWHSLPGRASRDAAKFTYLEKSNPDSRILYLYEQEFGNPAFITAKINHFVTNRRLILDQYDFSFSSVHVKLIDNQTSKKFLQSFHYAGHGRSGKKVFGCYLDRNLIAVCKFAPVVRKEVASSMKLQHSEVLELDRFCIHPNFQKKNFASWTISRCSKVIFSEMPNVKCLVSFSDSTYGHSGTIYKATGWTQVGEVPPDYYYVNPNGYVMHKKTLYNQAVKMKMKERAYAEKHGYVKMMGKKKRKFILLRPNEHLLIDTR